MIGSFADEETRKIHGGVPSKTLPRDIQRAARQPDREVKRESEWSVQHPHQRPVAHLFRLMNNRAEDVEIADYY